MVKLFYRDPEESSEGCRVLARRIGKVWVHRCVWTDSCSGCTELGECMGNAHLYPYDSKARCHIGAGCEECGFTGKRRTSWLLPVPMVIQRELNARLRELMKRQLAA